MSDLALADVSKVFPATRGRREVRVFRHLNLVFSSGETTAIVGKSGIGKTTLLNVIAGLTPVDEGEVRVARKPITAGKGLPLRLGYLFQRDALLPWRSALGNALLGVECRGSISEDVRDEASLLFQRFGLEGAEHAFPRTLSGGQRQRVALIQNILIKPEVLLLDEPFISLDYQTKLALEDEILETIDAQLARPTTVLVTHDIEEAVVMGDRVVVIGPQGCVSLDVRIPPECRGAVSGRQSGMIRDLFRVIFDALTAARRGEWSTA